MKKPNIKKVLKSLNGCYKNHTCLKKIRCELVEFMEKNPADNKECDIKSLDGCK
jgi:hypothetical protein